MIGKIKKHIEFLIFKLFKSKESFGYYEYQIGPYVLKLPENHPLKIYQTKYPRYDIPLGEIVQIVTKKYSNLKCIDIGANVGDTAALISKYAAIPTLCVEGNEVFLPILRENKKRIGEHIYIEETFVGPTNLLFDQSKIHTKNGTGTIVPALLAIDDSGSKEGIKVKTLSQIIEQNKKFTTSKLIKVDTDGLDFDILMGSLSIISKLKPVLFFEYDPLITESGQHKSIQTIRELMRIGYTHFMLYDNFGNYLLSTSELTIFEDINVYLRSNEKHTQIVCYLDVCAFHGEDTDLFFLTKSHEHQANEI